MTEEKKLKIKKNKVFDFSQYRIYTVTQQIFVGDYYYEGHITLYGKDEEIQLPKNIEDNSFYKKIKGHIAVPKGTHIQKQHNNMNQFNQYLKEFKGTIIKLT